MQEACLLVKTVDQKHFFTDLDHLPQLIEFSKIINAEISVVKLKEKIKIFSLPQLAKSVCDPNYKDQMPEYELVERKLSPFFGKNKRQKLLLQSSVIKDYIRKKFLSGEAVSISDISVKFRDFNLKENTIQKHFLVIKNLLVKEGYNVSKLEVSKYQVVF